MVELCILNNRMFFCSPNFIRLLRVVFQNELMNPLWTRINRFIWSPDPDHIKGTHPKTVLDSESHSMGSGFLVLDSSIFHWNLNSSFHSLFGLRIPWAVFWIPKPRIPDSTRKNFTDSRIRIPLQGAIHRFAVIYARVYHARLSQREFWN